MWFNFENQIFQHFLGCFKLKRPFQNKKGCSETGKGHSKIEKDILKHEKDVLKIKTCSKAGNLVILFISVAYL